MVTSWPNKRKRRPKLRNRNRKESDHLRDTSAPGDEYLILASIFEAGSPIAAFLVIPSSTTDYIRIYVDSIKVNVLYASS